MPVRTALPVASFGVLGGLLMAGIVIPGIVWERNQQGWKDQFPVARQSLTDVGSAPFWSLDAGTVATLKGGATVLVITVLDQTEMVDGVRTRIVEERETEAGKLIEVSRNYFALHPPTGDVYYFGESVDMYKDGKITGHECSWRSGENGARFGLFVPGKAAVGAKYYQEFAPKVAMDRAEIVSVTDSVKTGVGSHASCVRTRETTPLEPGVTEWKRYCPGIGLAEDGELKLVSLTRRK